MKEFLKSNTVTYNLMVFTAFKSVLIFTLLCEGPKTYKDIQKVFLEHEYLHEKISIDAIRVYMNSLQKIGCVISKKKVNRVTQFYIESHPFILNLSEKKIKSILKVYKTICKSIDINDLLTLQQFFKKFSKYIENTELKNELNNISPLSNIDPEIIKTLMTCTQNNSEITVLYNSVSSRGEKNITILADKLHINNSKLYLYGVSSEYKNYSSFLVSKIKKIISINIENKTLNIPELTVGYEYTKEENEKFEALDSERILSEDKNKVMVEITSNSKFEITQRILYHASSCKVLYPQDFKQHIINTLKQMKEGYID